MKLIQVLLSQPQSELVSRIRNLGINCNTHSRQQLTEELIKVLLNVGRTKSEWMNLKQSEQNILLQMCYAPFQITYSETELFTLLKKTQRDEYIDVKNSLKNKGWLYKDVGGNWVLPQELKELIHHFTNCELKETAIYLPEIQRNSLTIIDNLFLFMDYIEANKVRLTKNNIMHKHELTTILNQLSPKEKVPEEQWRFGYGRHYYFYPDCFSFLYDFVFEQGWIEETAGILGITDKWERGQLLSVNELLERVYRTYKGLYKRTIPQLSFITEILLKNLDHGEALEKKSLAAFLEKFVDSYYYDNSTTIVEKRIINMLIYINFLRTVTIDGSSYVSLSYGPGNSKGRNKKNKRTFGF